jgi:cobyrinic acid a,c-diamide synthase
LPERHLGLLQAEEIEHLDARLDAAAKALPASIGLENIAPVAFPAITTEPVPRLLTGLRIAVARDAAFSFLYRANLDLLQALGAECLFFSPLADSVLPECDAVYLPGGYPELHAARLSANTSLHESLRAHHSAGKPLLAECGGMMLLFDALVDRDGQRHRMVGLLPGETQMQPRLQALALQSVDLGHGALRGHSFHYSRLESTLDPTARGRTQAGTEGERVFCQRGLVASYVHFYMASNPIAAARLFRP